jgi:hypothetical protein
LLCLSTQSSSTNNQSALGHSQQSAMVVGAGESNEYRAMFERNNETMFR